MEESRGLKSRLEMTKQRKKLFAAAEEAEKGEEGEVQCGRSGRRTEEVSSPPPIRELSCSDVWLAIKADRQIAANDMCWESSQRWANDRRGETGRWLPSWKYACSTIPTVYPETA